jgi:K+-transporting ATPase ATPase C chain
MNSVFRPAITLLAALTLICCVAYPCLVTGIGQAVFADKANGSIVMREGKPIGSSLIGQAFTSPQYFWGRPSGTSPKPNDATASGGSNLSPANPAQIDAVKGRVEVLKAADPENKALVPVDLVTASASGLDPEISLAAAYYQVPRVARERKLSQDRVLALIDEHKVLPVMGVFGEPRVNVLALNLALENMH